MFPLRVLTEFAGQLLTCLKEVFLHPDSHPKDLLLLIQHFAFLGSETMEYVAKNGLKTLYDIYTTNFHQSHRNSTELVDFTLPLKYIVCEQRKVYDTQRGRGRRVKFYIGDVLTLMSSIVVSITFGDEWKGTNISQPKTIDSDRFIRRWRKYKNLVPFGLQTKIQFQEDVT